ncbi:MAG: DNA topoisomerase (ATP-hydrolyzing) subunit B [Candidatus Colwellbacteria bacterium]|nr:DNA topoisomerase (ATP-hydrolyzing) subunit B [Candidatus Colwellbacteria bacterium]
MPKEKDTGSSYSAKDIFILEGLDPVRKRPGMYIGSTGLEGLHHLIWEIVDNSIDEAMAGYAKIITVELLDKTTVKVTDDGRGIPVDPHPQTKKSALETIMTVLHAGGKFGGGGYKVSGGLHGVGASVVNALSTDLHVEVKRDGGLYVQDYKIGKPQGQVKKIGKAEGTGTSTTFSPDPSIFNEIDFDRKKILERMRQQAYLTKGIKMIFIDRRDETPFYYCFNFSGGIKTFVEYLNEGGEPLVQSEIFYVNRDTDAGGIEAAFAYTEDIEVKEMGFANNIYTVDGGMHITGLRTALTRTLNDYSRQNNYIKESDDNLTGDDVREGFVGVVSVKLSEPQFEGQTKAKLGNPEIKSAVDTTISSAFKEFLEKHPADAKKIIEKCLLAAKARKAAKAAKETVLRKGVLEGLTLPGKLADCQTKKMEDAELYIVEGDSAGGSAKQGRDRKYQAILPLRGKILNVEKAQIHKMLANNEVRSLIVALGTAISAEFDITKLRYGKIIIMTDADVDGAHIRILLLTLFYRHFQKLLDNGNVFIAEPPLYKVQSGKTIRYAYSEQEKDDIVKLMSGNPSLQRYKGLGEMNPDQLWETTMNPETRTLRVVNVEDAQEADKMFDMLMGSEVEPRKRFITVHAQSVKNLDI